jgi:hypothetical protein
MVLRNFLVLAWFNFLVNFLILITN